jgi:hypothetical protein
MRIAERADMSTDADEKERLGSLAANLATTLEAVVSTTEDRLDERAKAVEDIVKKAAEPDSGEFLVPLSAARVDAMRTTLQKMDPSDLDEGFLSTIDAWMNKSHEDGMDGMVGILQKVLQIYAGTAISRARAQLLANVGAAVAGKDQSEADALVAAEQPKPTVALLEELLNINTDVWDATLMSRFSDNNESTTTVTASSLMSEVQRTIEGVVLGLENGSMAQRVQAEYLRELVTRIEALDKEPKQ